MPRRNRRAREAERAHRPSAPATSADGFQVRRIPGSGADKTYRCPGCDHPIAPGTPHVVAWADGGDGEDRRHWHTGCWNARGRRRPGHYR